ncbi:MAG: transporter [Opitutus sp.]|nr:transporter [Opitutus sp.]
MAWRRHWGVGILLFLAARLGAQVTETPQTIAPGSFFVRMDAISVGVNRDRIEPSRYNALGLASTILSTGLTRDVDLEVGVQFFLRQTFQTSRGRTSRSGRGDLILRSKWTFWRDPGRGAAAAVIPYLKLPSSTGGVGNNHTEGGFIVPWSMALGSGTEMGAMGQWDVLRNDANTRYDSRWFVSGFARQHIFGSLGAYAETTFAVSSASASTFTGTLGGGLTFDLKDKLQLDYGLSRGLGRQATDWINVLRLRWEF